MPLGEPTNVSTCPICGRTKGPYYDKAQARAAMTDHIAARHPERLGAMSPDQGKGSQ